MNMPIGPGGPTGEKVGSLAPPNQRALLIVREAEDDRVAHLQHRQDVGTMEAVRSGWVPQTETEWSRVRLVAFRLEHPPLVYDQEGVADQTEDFSTDISDLCFREAYGQILRCRQALATAQQQAPPPLVLSGDGDDDPFMTMPDRRVDARFFPGGVRPLVEPVEWSTRESPEIIVRLQDNLQTAEQKLAERITESPWTAFRLGLGPDPTTPAYRGPRVVMPRDPFTNTSVKKRREQARASRGKIPILLRWARSQAVMYDDVVAEIGICPADVDVNGHRVYTLDRIVNAKGYVPGNLRWADKSLQRQNQARMR